MTLQARRARILREIEQALPEVREQKKQAEALLVEARATERALVNAERALRKIKAPPRPATTPNSRRIAGPRAISRVADVLSHVGRTTQAEITRATGLNSGTVTHALRVLREDKKAKPTKRSLGGSAEWAWQGPAYSGEYAPQERAA